MTNATTAAAPRLTANEIVASNIRAELARAGSKPADLARIIGEGEMWLSRRLSSKVAFSTNEVQTIADTLGVEPGELFIVHERKTPRPGLGAGRRNLYLLDSGVGPSGIEPLTSTVESRHFTADHLAPIIPISSHRTDNRAPLSAAHPAG